MILALILGGLGFLAAAVLPGTSALLSLVVIPPMVWLMVGGGDRWLERREACRRARLP